MDGAGQVWKQVKKSKLTDSQWKTLLKSGGVLNDKKTLGILQKLRNMATKTWNGPTKK